MRKLTLEEYELATEIIDKVAAAYIGTTRVEDATMARMCYALDVECHQRQAADWSFPEMKWDVRPIMRTYIDGSGNTQTETMGDITARPVLINGEKIEWEV